MKQCCSPKCTVLSQQGGTMSRAITKFRFLVKCTHFNHQNIATINNHVTSISSVSTNRCHKPDWNKKIHTHVTVGKLEANICWSERENIFLRSSFIRRSFWRFLRFLLSNITLLSIWALKIFWNSCHLPIKWIKDWVSEYMLDASCLSLGRTCLIMLMWLLHTLF